MPLWHSLNSAIYYTCVALYFLEVIRLIYLLHGAVYVKSFLQVLFPACHIWKTVNIFRELRTQLSTKLSPALKKSEYSLTVIPWDKVQNIESTKTKLYATKRRLWVTILIAGPQFNTFSPMGIHTGTSWISVFNQWHLSLYLPVELHVIKSINMGLDC